MSSTVNFDPFKIMPFEGYVDPTTGTRERYISLVHFYYSEQLRGLDEQYRQYILNLSDPELFRLEVEGVWQSQGENGEGRASRIFYAGIYMQASNNRTEYMDYLANITNLSVTNCENDNIIAEALGLFFNDISGSNEQQRKVVFLGSCPDKKFMLECINTIFSKNLPHCIFSLEGDDCVSTLSEYAISSASAFNLISSSLSVDEAAESIARRCTHAFMFKGSASDPKVELIANTLIENGISVRPIQTNK